MRRIFWGFCRNWFLMSPLHYLSGCSDFGFEFARYSRYPRYHRCGESPTLRIGDMGSRRLPVSLSRGVNYSPHHWCTELLTPRITVTESRLLNFLKENSLYRWYGEWSTPCTSDTVSADSPYLWVGESPTPRITDTESRRLRVSLSRGVDDSVYWWYGESLFDQKIYLASNFSTLNG